jgi:outer membrane protein TolC
METTAIRKAECEYRKASRQAAAGHGVTGDLRANYYFGRGRVKTEYHDENVEDDIDTSGWGVSLMVRVPVWDGGAGGAAVKAARLQAEQARLEYENKVKDARAGIVTLLHDLDASSQRLDIIKHQIELAAERLRIAESRYQDGQISQITFLESRIRYGEHQDRHLEALAEYLVLRLDLEHRFLAP